MFRLKKSAFLLCHRSQKAFDAYCCVFFFIIFLSHIHATAKTDTRYQLRNREADDGAKDLMQDYSTNRANTLFDDADDIQKQLDNEAEDRNKLYKPKTIWVFHFPTQLPTYDLMSKEELLRLRRQHNQMAQLEEEVDWSRYMSLAAQNKASQAQKETLPDMSEWNYLEQANWSQRNPDCKGLYQSPVSIPLTSMVKAKGARPLQFLNFAVTPKNMTIKNYRDVFVLFGEWDENTWPFIYGGAVHGRRYKFHSMTFHWPSEHLLATFLYPMESQALFVSAEYPSILDAIEAAPMDQQSIVCIASLYSVVYTKTHPGTRSLIDLVMGSVTDFDVKDVPLEPLETFIPEFKEYACYYGSLSTPPCTESVLWMIRAKALSITRDDLQRLFSLGQPGQVSTRKSSNLNDRKVYLFT